MTKTVLSPRELIQQTLAGIPPHRLPIGELIIDDDLVRELVGLDADEDVPLPAKKALLERWGHDLVSVSFSHGWGAATQPDFLDSLARVTYWSNHSDLFVFALIDGPFSLAARAWSWEEALTRFSSADAELEAFLADAIIDTGDLFRTLADLGANGVIIGDDIAFRRGPYINPEKLRRSYFPFLTLMVGQAQDMGLGVIFHSDGNLWTLWNDILRSGVDGVQCLDAYSAMSLELARQRSDESFCLWGNLDLGWLMRLPERDEIQSYLNEQLQAVRGTPFIFGTSSGLSAGLSLPHLDAVYEIARSIPWSKPAGATKP
jgi:uroporphyrinogen decarboxylase